MSSRFWDLLLPDLQCINVGDAVKTEQMPPLQPRSHLTAQMGNLPCTSLSSFSMTESAIEQGEVHCFPALIMQCRE